MMGNKVKVAHICTSKVSYRILEYKLKRIAEQGYEVSIISSNDCEADDSVFKKCGIEQFYIEMDREISIIKDIKSIIEMKKLLKEEKFDIVHTHTAKAGIIGRIGAFLARTPVIIHTSHGLPFYEGMNPIKYFIYKNLELFVAKLSDYVGSQNKEDAETLRGLIKDSNKVFYEGNGVDLEYIDKCSEEISEEDLFELKNNLNINEENFVILMGARFEAIKNHRLFVEAIKEVIESGYTNIVCVLAGDGPLQQEIIKLTKSLNIYKHFRFVGKRNDMFKFIKMSDIVALTSEKEGIPRILMEGMAFAKPVVATDVLGTRELVVDNQTALLSKYGNVNHLSNNIYKIISDKKLRYRLGESGRKRVEEEFTEIKVARKVDSIYINALNKTNNVKEVVQHEL